MLENTRENKVFNHSDEHLPQSKNSLSVLSNLLQHMSTPGPKNDANIVSEHDTRYDIESFIERHDVSSDICIWRVRWKGHRGGDTYETQQHLLQELSQVEFDNLTLDYTDFSKETATKDQYPDGHDGTVGLTQIRRATLRQWIMDMFQKRSFLSPVLRDRQTFVNCNTCNKVRPNEASWNGPNQLHTTCTRCEVTFAATKRWGDTGSNIGTTQLIKTLVEMAEQNHRDYEHTSNLEVLREHRTNTSMISSNHLKPTVTFPNGLGQKLIAYPCKRLNSRLKLVRGLTITLCTCNKHCQCKEHPDALRGTSVWKAKRNTRTKNDQYQETVSSPWRKYIIPGHTHYVMLTATSKLFCSCPYFGRHGIPCEHMIAVLGPDLLTLDDFDIRWGARVHAGLEDEALWTHFETLHKHHEFGIHVGTRVPLTVPACDKSCAWDIAELYEGNM